MNVTTFKHVFRDKIILWSTLLSVVLLIALAVYIVIFYQQLPPTLPLYNRMPWGYDRLGIKPQLFIPSSVAVVFFLINLFAIGKMYNRNVFVSRMLGFVSFIVILCVSIYFLNIIRLVL